MKRRQKIYCAGPLFTDKEREEMTAMATALEEAGFTTFLPQRDGLELAKCVDYLVADGMHVSEASKRVSRAIFSLDVYQVLHGCDVLVANLNGRVPDEGTVSEAAMAYSRGKPVVGYKADSRTAFDGQDNPLVAGLFQFQLCDSIAKTVEFVTRIFQNEYTDTIPACVWEEETMVLGNELSSVLERKEDVLDVILHSERAYGCV
jgi:nucleoside 2-deoxyribosyltransferase